MNVWVSTPKLCIRRLVRFGRTRPFEKFKKVVRNSRKFQGSQKSSEIFRRTFEKVFKPVRGTFGKFGEFLESSENIREVCEKCKNPSKNSRNFRKLRETRCFGEVTGNLWVQELGGVKNVTTKNPMNYGIGQRAFEELTKFRDAQKTFQTFMYSRVIQELWIEKREG